MNRICIYQKDIQRITGKSERQSRNIIIKIKAQQNKQSHQLVTIEEFCDYMGLKVIDVLKLIR